jgi:hypothetical protein
MVLKKSKSWFGYLIIIFKFLKKLNIQPKNSKIYQLFGENSKFLKVFEIKWIENSFIIIFSKK